jgi:hypothetical protein
MVSVFHRRLTFPLWTVAFFTVAVTASAPATLILLTVFGIAAGGVCVRTLSDATRSSAGDALDLVRMDDDGGWQKTRPPT